MSADQGGNRGRADAVRAAVADRVTAVFTTFNSAGVIESALRSISKSVPCIVVDNASRDETTKIVESTRPGTRVVALNKNLGFGRGCNLGLRLVETDYGVVINPDAVLSEDCLELCTAAADAHHDVALFAAPAFRKEGQAREHKLGEIRPVEVITGAFMFMRMKALVKIGLFDENIFMYFEDNDLCLRTLSAGYGIAEVAGAQIYHAGGCSTAPKFDDRSEKARIWGQSCAYFAAKHKNRAEGRRAARKANLYGWKRWWMAATMNFTAAHHYRAKWRGVVEFRRFGAKVMHTNAFNQTNT